MAPATAPVPVSPPVLLTAEDYLALPDDGRRTELVKGVVVEMPQPTPSHGYYCVNIARELSTFVKANDLGRVVSNDSGIITRREPDTVRGSDVAFYSYERVPRGLLPKGYWPPPDLLFEVRSPSNRWATIMLKIGEYFAIGVKMVCVLDPDIAVLTVFQHDEIPHILDASEEFTAPGILPGFRVIVKQFLE